MLTQIKQKSKFTQKIFFIGQGLGFEGILSLDFCWLFRSLLQRNLGIFGSLKTWQPVAKIQIFQEFGFGKKSIGSIIEEEAMSVVEEDFLEKFSKQGSTHFHSFQNMFF